MGEQNNNQVTIWLDEEWEINKIDTHTPQKLGKKRAKISDDSVSLVKF